MLFRSGFDATNVKQAMDADADCDVGGVVVTDANGMLFLNYSELLAMLWKATQELEEGGSTGSRSNAAAMASWGM